LKTSTPLSYGGIQCYASALAFFYLDGAWSIRRAIHQSGRLLGTKHQYVN